jgi:DNA-binding transcriptional ArsR family regulator
MTDLPNTVFRALSDQTRRDILKLLRSGPRTSGEIASRFESTWPTISRHLAILRDAGLVVTERQGQAIQYELNTTVLQEVVQHLVEWASPATSKRVLQRRRTAKPQEA